MKVFELIDNFSGPELTASYTDEEIVGMRGELRKVVADLVAIRADQRKTEEYFNNTIRKYNGAYLNSEELILSLHRVLDWDKLSFSYIYHSITIWAQEAYNEHIPAFVLQPQRNIQYAIDFDLDEIEEMITQAENPAALIKALMDKSKGYISVRSDYKSKVEEALLTLYEKYTQSALNKGVSVVCDFLVSQEDAEEKMKSLHYILDGKYGKDLAIAVCAAVDAGIISKSPSYKKLAAFFDVKGSSSGYEAYQNSFLGGKQLKGRDSAAYQGYLTHLLTH